MLINAITNSKYNLIDNRLVFLIFHFRKTFDFAKIMKFLTKMIDVSIKYAVDVIREFGIISLVEIGYFIQN